MLNSEIHNNPKVENFREKAHLDIRDIDEVLTTNKIEYFLSAGTMLGAVREKDFIEQDFDIDLCSMGFPEEIVRIMIQRDFKLKGFEVMPHEGTTSGMMSVVRNVKTDIHFFERKGRLALCKHKQDEPLFTIPLEYIKLRKARLGKFKYNVISNKYLDSVYRDWRTPMKENYFKPDYYYFETE